MGWASYHIQKLKEGKTVQFRPRGHSMSGKIESGQLVTVTPLNEGEALEPGDIVLCKVGGTEYLHLVKALNGEFALIGNNRGSTNGWTPYSKIYGKCIRVED